MSPCMSPASPTASQSAEPAGTGASSDSDALEVTAFKPRPPPIRRVVEETLAADVSREKFDRDVAEKEHAFISKLNQDLNTSSYRGIAYWHEQMQKNEEKQHMKERKKAKKLKKKRKLEAKQRAKERGDGSSDSASSQPKASDSSEDGPVAKKSKKEKKKKKKKKGDPSEASQDPSEEPGPKKLDASALSALRSIV